MLGLMLGTDGVGQAGKAGLTGKAAALVNRRTGRVLATSVEIARTRATRRRGLLGRDSIDASGAFVLSPCCAIHTAFMRFAIDVVFVDKNGAIVSILHELQPWNLAVRPRARAVIEMASGALRAHDIQVGDSLVLSLQPPPPGKH
jgi:hypothetical protein